MWPLKRNDDETDDDENDEEFDEDVVMQPGSSSVRTAETGANPPGQSGNTGLTGNSCNVACCSAGGLPVPLIGTHGSIAPGTLPGLPGTSLGKVSFFLYSIIYTHNI